MAWSIILAGTSAAHSHVPAQMVTSIGHSRSSSWPKRGPLNSCTTLVTMDGATSSAAACTGGMTSPSRPTATVGRPRPTTPLTKPASRKVRPINANSGPTWNIDRLP
ncbi:hypothetical protein D3C87_1212410 [compost metagenome]